ncbi:hypothetical protein ACU3L3_00880 [Priestia endophytica]|jgi:hypothetical protein|uniref:Uncharacterized protein n=1 Tax=Priestia endophytica DSM 13796 TaxID=1121089 RepID=A0A1I5ZUV4_9BACI|nr:hypothetical protein [Priestia endophytica]KAB2490616.1 hypothetical protein F8155_19915 [Priestia endophytica]KYG28539.1 hypothetical protein AZF06_11275 [Priestia endophytica]MBG9810744.1 hypothetical protein [Priestia endophytica]RAS77528.1 hypothetical protein A4R27_18560 [Priestia endophytica]SFQ60192.1 hypothetical protein SAMN02745910_02253 [Priestia endophytica DSM 13796]
MLKDLPQGVKVSITRSITKAFEDYMSEIKWNESQYSSNAFIDQWKTYIRNNASWFKKIDESMKESPEFHQELAVKINETIQKVITEPPTEEQVAQLERLTKEQGNINVDYSCKAEARFWIHKFVN